MASTSSLLPQSKARLGYWLLALVALAVLAGAVYLFVGTLVTGLFLYYAVRPANRRIRSVIGSDGWAAIVTLVLVVLPLLALVGYVAFLGVQSLDALLNQSVRNLVAPYVDVGEIRSLSDIASDPEELLDRLRQSGLQGVIDWIFGAVGLLANAVVHVFLMTAVVFYLLRDDRRLAAWYRDAVGDGSPAHVLGQHVDRDISSVYFSNILFMSSIAVLSALGYSVFNLVAPASMRIPLPIVLGVLTGVASIVPLVVGKLVYVPIAVYLFGAALQNPNDLLVYPIAFTVCAFLFLDFIPLTFLLPVMAGRTLHSGLMIFAYVGGTLVFGWYGLFLGPLVLVVTLRVSQDLVPDLIRGSPVALGSDAPSPSPGERGGAAADSSDDVPSAVSRSDDTSDAD
ncbi:AI-2E family transporter [Halomarina oriensis]|uniref:AI-2E family transporter n=1 Tax=Halomarina oriensis TaxID=671145 RepID=A0A6B0GM41_9EURY|nr:AI-2E family transporter [Halomarina oriensis]MWG35922.1 AI-2E family transporter [Halomarina oriensis]